MVLHDYKNNDFSPHVPITTISLANKPTTKSVRHKRSEDSCQGQIHSKILSHAVNHLTAKPTYTPGTTQWRIHFHALLNML